MANITLRSVKGSPLTLTEMDSNFTNINTEVTTHKGSGDAAHAEATLTVSGFMSSADKTKLNGIATSANNYTLPVATAAVLGGVKSGSGVTIAADGTISANPGTAFSDDTTTDAIRYPTFSAASSGTASTIYTASTKLSYNPSSGQLNSVFFNATSDARLKTDIEQITNALETITKLNGKTYKFIESSHVSSGVIAQELQKVIPNAVSDRGDGYLSVNYNSLLPYLIEAIKELRAEIAILKQA